MEGMMSTTTPSRSAELTAGEILAAARRAGLPTSDTLAIVKSITGIGPDVRIIGPAAAVANVAGAQFMAGADPVAVVAELARA